ncbi:hypothetical protein E4U42_003292 [Claviceps africana]|uniref:Uncharacterized protein n=1 Tax=Claviceps africana TaxID=83212 RepID=A0A8K0J867_9HYPO|nr:hypothetical protein E4U42_003292 [Claviceps africana]
MPSLKTFLAAAGLAALAVADTISITAMSNNTFSPDSVTAKQGDVLEFRFPSGNHSVVAGDYDCPCFALPPGSGFSSGTFDANSYEDDKVFRVTLSNADPVVFYSSQGDDCSKGMVGIVNPNEKQTLHKYRMRASQLARCTTDKCCYGEESVDEEASCDVGDKDSKCGKKDSGMGTKDSGIGKNDTSCGPKDNPGDIIVKSSVNMLQVPLFAVTVVMGGMVALAGL